MNEERFEQPTPRKLKKAHAKGEVARSLDLVASLLLTLGVILSALFSSFLIERFKELMEKSFSSSETMDPIEMLGTAVSLFITPLSVIFILFFFTAIFGYLLQGQWIFLWKPKESLFKKNVAKGAVGRLLFSLMKLSLAIVVGFFSFSYLKSISTGFFYASSDVKMHVLFKFLLFLAFVTIAIFLVLGLLDLFYQKWRFNKMQRMTKQELKDEKREAEGDRQIKNKMQKRK